MANRKSIILCIAANKGGSGKTSVATNLAGVANKLKIRTLLVDLDGQSNVNETFGLKEAKYTMHDVFKGRCRIEQTIKPYNDNLHIVQAGEGMSAIELELLTPRNRPAGNLFEILDKALQPIREQYDYIIIDTPPSLGLIAGNAFTASDYVLIPFVPEVYCIKGMRRVIDAVRDFQSMGNRVKILGVVPTFVTTLTTVHTDLLDQARRHCVENDIPITDTVIPRAIVFATTVYKESKPATLSKEANNPVVKKYNDLWNEITEAIKNELSNGRASESATAK